jgi:hypothetical protein
VGAPSQFLRLPRLERHWRCFKPFDDFIPAAARAKIKSPMRRPAFPLNDRSRAKMVDDDLVKAELALKELCRARTAERVQNGLLGRVL